MPSLHRTRAKPRPRAWQIAPLGAALALASLQAAGQTLVPPPQQAPRVTPQPMHKLPALDATRQDGQPAAPRVRAPAAPAQDLPQPAPNWRAADIQAGQPLPPAYRDRVFVVEDWREYGLEAPPPGQQWVQIGGRYLLVSSGGNRMIRFVRP